MSETSVDSGLPPDNSSWDSLDSQSEPPGLQHLYPSLSATSSFRQAVAAANAAAATGAAPPATPQHHYASIVVTPGAPVSSSPLASSSNVSSHYGTPMISRHQQRAFPRTNPTCSMTARDRSSTASTGSGPAAAAAVTSAVSCISIASEGLCSVSVTSQGSVRDSTGSGQGGCWFHAES